MQKRGADAAKFQTYKAHLITSKHAPGYWDLTEEKTRISLNYSLNLIISKKKIIMNLQIIANRLV